VIQTKSPTLAASVACRKGKLIERGFVSSLAHGVAVGRRRTKAEVEAQQQTLQTVRKKNATEKCDRNGGVGLIVALGCIRYGYGGIPLSVVW
jgi:hypothetical protein